jgi:predicted Zn-dependent protease
MARFSNRFALALAVAMVLPEMFPVGALGRAAAQVAVPEPKRPSDDDAAIPDSIAPAPAVLQAVTAGWMTDDERKDFRVLHGIFDDLDLDTPLRRALVALERWRLDDPALDDASVPRHLKAERWLRVGAHARVLEITEGASDLPSLARRAQAFAALARRDEALALASRPSVGEALAGARDIDDVLAAVDLGALRIRLDAAAGPEYRRLLGALARARQELDRLDPRIRLREAQLLADRHAMKDAVGALGEALALCPRSAEGWRLAGTLAIARFDFGGAASAAAALRRLDPAHPFAAFLEVQSLLTQDDAEGAREALADTLAVPARRPAEALAWLAAAEASRYDFAAMRAALAEADALEPGSAAALVACGRQLAFDRQYAEAREVLGAAAAREPAWALPRAELGLLSMQDGREDTAVADLRAAVALDPNDERTLFTLKLAEQLAGWNRIEAAHFILRHPDGDAALVARLLAGVLDPMHAEVCARLGHEPAQKTLIDVMPDHRSFGVRITGLPRIHTIAVCTGPTIAIEIPKEGAQERHLGLFDPLAVLRHEYTHTVTLSMTRNRIPHWLTEAVAVALEDTPRTFETCQMLAAAWQSGTLFDLDAINWGFIRPRKPTDRAQAYAQGRWMVEFIERTYGWEPLRKLLFSYAEGIREEEAMQRAFGVGRDEFFARFVQWAGGEVRAWGLAPTPSMRDLAMRLAEGDDSAEQLLRAAERERLARVARAWADAIGRPGRERFGLRAGEWPARPMPRVEFDDATVKAFLAEFPAQPDLVEILLRRARGAGAAGTAETRALLERYAALRPVDPFPHRVWAKLAIDANAALDAGGDAAALVHLRELDLRSDKDNIYALAIARNRRAAGDLPAALEAAERAVRMNPFDATVRELAAAIAVEGGRLDRAAVHIEALTALEPDRAIHRQRLERLKAMSGAGGG